MIKNLKKFFDPMIDQGFIKISTQKDLEFES